MADKDPIIRWPSFLFGGLFSLSLSISRFIDSKVKHIGLHIHSQQTTSNKSLFNNYKIIFLCCVYFCSFLSLADYDNVVCYSLTFYRQFKLTIITFKFELECVWNQISICISNLLCDRVLLPCTKAINTTIHTILSNLNSIVFSVSQPIHSRIVCMGMILCSEKIRRH